MIYRILYPLSLLPLQVLFLLSDFAYFNIYYVFKYRRKVVSQNIEKSFAFLNAKERVRIEKGFYRSFCDHFIETLKLLSISKEALHKRITVDYSEIEKVVSENKNCHVYLGHQFNWEWANAHISSVLNHNIIVAYKPISSKQFNTLMKDIRGRFGSKLVSSIVMKKEIETFGSKPHVLILVADQNPNIPMKSFWTTFLSQKTAFLNGPEIYTASNKTIAFFANIVREKRGHYKMEVSRLFDFSEPYKMGLITELYARKLERSIIDNPENYLWSHRRWKHVYKDEYMKRSIENLSCH